MTFLWSKVTLIFNTAITQWSATCSGQTDRILVNGDKGVLPALAVLGMLTWSLLSLQITQ